MIRLILGITFSIYEYFRYKKNLLIKKDVNKILFQRLKENLKKKKITSKKNVVVTY